MHYGAFVQLQTAVLAVFSQHSFCNSCSTHLVLLRYIAGSGVSSRTVPRHSRGFRLAWLLESFCHSVTSSLGAARCGSAIIVVSPSLSSALPSRLCTFHCSLLRIGWMYLYDKQIHNI